MLFFLHFNTSFSIISKTFIIFLKFPQIIFIELFYDISFLTLEIPCICFVNSMDLLHCTFIIHY